jgi:hypothetical protein
MINLFPSPLATAASVSFAAISPIENEKLPLCDIVCINIKYILYYWRSFRNFEIKRNYADILNSKDNDLNTFG